MTAAADDLKPADGANGGCASTQRIDKWLWCARFFKSRALAAAFVTRGAVRLSRNGSVRRLERASALVRIGDVLSFVHRLGPCAILVEDIPARRGPPAEARRLYRVLAAGEDALSLTPKALES